MFKEYLTFDDVNIRPQYSEIESRSTIDLSSRLTKTWNIDVPIISAPMDTVTGYNMAAEMIKLGACGALHRFDTIEERCEKVKRLYEIGSCLPICASIGVTKDYLEDARKLEQVGVDILLLDVAHGHHALVKKALLTLKSNLGDVDIIAGNVSTYEGCKFLEDHGADAIRFGQGNGSLCETRIRTGIGIPQISGLMEATGSIDIPIIADGGIRVVGDVAKALAAGADTVMLGSLFSGTKETPGEIAKVGRWPNEQLFKKYMGAASHEAKKNRGEEKNVEGNSKLVPYKGKVKRIVTDIVEGVQSSCSYVGAKDLNEFRAKAEFVKVTPAGAVEANPHLL